MDKRSVGARQFRRKSVLGDDTCLFWSFLHLIKLILKGIFGDISFDSNLMKVINEGLRVLVADYIRQHSELHILVLSSGTPYATVEEYCLALEEGKLWGGDPELKVLSDLYNIIICVINPEKIRSNGCLLPSYYGEDNPLAKECVYIYFNGRDHYDPLHLVNLTNESEIKTIFDPNDSMTNDLLRRYINEEFHHDGDVELGVHIDTSEEELPDRTDSTKMHLGSNETKLNSHPILSNTSVKRKESELDDIAMSSTNDKLLPVLIAQKYYNPNKRIKSTRYSTDQIPSSGGNITEAKEIEELIQIADLPDESLIRNIPANEPMILNDDGLLNSEFECSSEPSS